MGRVERNTQVVAKHRQRGVFPAYGYPRSRDDSRNVRELANGFYEEEAFRKGESRYPPWAIAIMNDATDP